jgi:pyridoxine 5-phosphate synthase
MAGLAVNVDHIATLRQARGQVKYPDPAAAAVLAELAGADGIVAHLREDRRHIQDQDVRVLRNVVRTKLILEMAATPEMVGVALDIRPDVVTLVPEKREELTTEGGLDLVVHKNNIAETVETLQSSGIPVSLFVDPDPEQIKLAHRTNALFVELHTGSLCDAVGPVKRQQALDKIVEAARLARKLRLGVHAGHGLCYSSIKAFKGISEIQEFSIGHSIVSRAAMVGMEQAVRDMAALIREL